MSEKLSAISTEALLEANPVYLDRAPDVKGPRGKHSYYVVRKSDDVTIGHTRIKFFNDGTKELGNPAIWGSYQDNGYGLALYVAANRTPDDHGENPPLQAQVMFLSHCAERIWESLVERGLATGQQDVADPYRFVTSAL